MTDFAVSRIHDQFAFTLADGWHAVLRTLRVRLLREATNAGHGELPAMAAILKLREVEVVGLLNLYCQWPYVNLTRQAWNLPALPVQGGMMPQEPIPCASQNNR